jgi:peptidoglycan/xylan/chitin deacetylase (PgdA/CDA1 family)
VSVSRKLALSAARGRVGNLAVRAAELFDGGHRLAVLMYHRIGADRAALLSMARGLGSATVADFEQQLQEVTRRFRVIGLDELLALREHTALPGKQNLLMVTFDDGYSDFADVAWPVIQRCGVPVTMFVATAMPDAGVPYWWDQLAYSIRVTRSRELAWGTQRLPLLSDQDRESAYRAVHDDLQRMQTASTVQRVAELADALDAGTAPSEVLGWQELKQLRLAGLAIGAHSHAHHRLDKLSGDELRADLATCRTIMARELAEEPRAFAYPTGYYDQRVERAVRDAGFDISFTTERGVSDDRQVDWYRVPRIHVGVRSDGALLSLQALSLRRRAARPDEASI